jgi:hypothetical protein
MAEAAIPSAAGRRDYELLAQQRKRAESRLARERANNARIAILTVGALVGVLAIGIRAGWEPLGLGTRQLSPADERAREFAATRTANILLKTSDPDLCREVQFHNDDGTFTGRRTVRCDDAVTAATGTVQAQQPDRVTAVRDWFNKGK